MDENDDMNWIDDELMEEEFYNAFYNSPIETIQIVQMLFDNNCEKCYNVSRSSYQLKTPGCFSSEELIPILRCQTQQGFNPFSILKFALEVDFSKINDFIESDISYNNILTQVSYTNNIIFKESIKVLEPTATIFILYNKKNIKRNRNTRAIRIKTSNNTNKLNKTRRRKITFE